MHTSKIMMVISMQILAVFLMPLKLLINIRINKIRGMIMSIWKKLKEDLKRLQDELDQEQGARAAYRKVSTGSRLSPAAARHRPPQSLCKHRRQLLSRQPLKLPKSVRRRRSVDGTPRP